MSENELNISLTEITVLIGKTKGFKLNIDNKLITIPVDEAVFTHFQNQFWRETPTQQQKQRFATLLNLMRAAYTKGKIDGKKSV